MAIRKILLPLTGTAAGEAALATALTIARCWNAHVLALHVRVDSRDVAPLAGEGLSGAMIEEMMSATEKESSDRAHAVRSMFDRFVARQDVPVQEAHPNAGHASASFAAVTGREEEIIAHQARIADLTIVPHPQAGEDVAAADALHAVLFDSGRPVLLAPVDPPVSIGKRIAVAWNGTAYAASALASVMPFIRQAQAVRVLTSEDYFRRGPSAAEVAEYISHHGVAADVVEFRPIDRIVGAGLLAAAGDFGADLMSMGAYSTSRLRQLILGGTTRHVLENAMLPVLMNR